MRYLSVGVLVAGCLCLGTPAQAQTDPQLMAPIHQFIDSFNKGDAAGAAATHAAEADLVIIDEVAPYAWHGPQAFMAWATDLQANDKSQGITDEKVSIGAATRVESKGESAYVIVPTVYTFTEKGVAMRVAAQMTLVLKKGPDGWLIHGWTWTGPRAHKVSAAGK